MNVIEKQRTAQSLVRELLSNPQYEGVSERDGRIAEAKKHLHAANIFFKGGRYDAAIKNAEEFLKLLKGARAIGFDEGFGE